MLPSHLSRVLLVSDPGDLLALGRAVFRAAGARVQVARSLEELGAVLGGDAPDLLLVDLGLGWADATELCLAMRGRWDHVHLQVMVDQVQDEGLDRLLRARPDGRLPAGSAGLAVLAERLEQRPSDSVSAPVAADAQGVPPRDSGLPERRRSLPLPPLATPPRPRAQHSASHPPASHPPASPPPAGSTPDRSLAELAHDLHQPLRTLERTAQQLTDRDADLGQRLEGDLRRLRDMVDGALASAGHPSLVVEGDLAPAADQVLDEVLDSLGALLDETGARIARSPLPAVGLARPDLRRVLQNLVSNALQHGGEPPVVTVSGRREGPWSVVVVSDNGPGIPADQREHVFEPLARLTDGWTSGRGLGLAICKRLVEAGGGWIDVDEVASGGASFSVWLPTPWHEEAREA